VLRKIIKASSLIWLLLTSTAWAQPTWLLVDTQNQELRVIQGQRIIARFEGISLGRGGVDQLHRRGDQKTPLGIYHVTWINNHSRFYRFIGLDYPTLMHAKLAYMGNLIDVQTFDDIDLAVRRGRLPPQNTPLGGNLGIHGIGSGDSQIHSAYNWTEGCIALTNTQMDKLLQFVNLGTKVVIE
jgi:murein L,D-transpeptidase YafK